MHLNYFCPSLYHCHGLPDLIYLFDTPWLISVSFVLCFRKRYLYTRSLSLLFKYVWDNFENFLNIGYILAEYKGGNTWLQKKVWRLSPTRKVASPLNNVWNWSNIVVIERDYNCDKRLNILFISFNKFLPDCVRRRLEFFQLVLLQKFFFQILYGTYLCVYFIVTYYLFSSFSSRVAPI